jgi:hypothetical protein
MNWALIDLILISALIIITVVFISIKVYLGLPNWWTGFFPLGLLPVPVADYFKDRKLST